MPKPAREMNHLVDIVGFISIFGALLVLPALGYGIQGWKGLAFSVCVWLAYWRIVKWLFPRLDTKKTGDS